MNLIVQYDFIFRALINKYHCSLYTVDSTIVTQFDQQVETVRTV